MQATDEKRETGLRSGEPKASAQRKDFWKRRRFGLCALVYVCTLWVGLVMTAGYAQGAYPFDGLRGALWFQKFVDMKGLDHVLEALSLCSLLFGGLIAIAERRVVGIPVGRLVNWRYPGFYIYYFLLLAEILLGIYVSASGLDKVVSFLLTASVLVGVVFVGWVCCVFLLRFDRRDELAYSYYWYRLERVETGEEAWRIIGDLAGFVGSVAQQGRRVKTEWIARMCVRAVHVAAREGAALPMGLEEAYEADAICPELRSIFDAKHFWGAMLGSGLGEQAQTGLTRSLLAEWEALAEGDGLAETRQALDLFTAALVLELRERAGREEGPWDAALVRRVDALSERRTRYGSAELSEDMRGRLIWACGGLLVVDFVQNKALPADPSEVDLFAREMEREPDGVLLPLWYVDWAYRYSIHYSYADFSKDIAELEQERGQKFDLLPGGLCGLTKYTIARALEVTSSVE